MIMQIPRDSVLISPDVADKEQALNTIIETACAVYHIPDPEEIYAKVIERESKLSTGIGLEVAVPHCRSKQVESIIITTLMVPRGVEYNSVDRKPVKIILFIVSPEHDIREHLACLSTISHAVSDDTVRGELLAAETGEQLHGYLVKMFKVHL